MKVTIQSELVEKLDKYIRSRKALGADYEAEEVINHALSKFLNRKNHWDIREMYIKIHRKTLWETQPHRCYYCLCKLTEDTVTLDHKTPPNRGGSLKKIDNFVLSCNPCNVEKGMRTAEEYIHVKSCPQFLAEQAIQYGVG